jgi:hypothetical protein
MWDPHQGKHSDTFRYTTKELCSTTAQYATSSKPTKFQFPPGSREVTPSSDREAPSDVAVQSTREGADDSKRRHKQHPHGAMTTTDYDDDNNGKAGNFGMECITTTTHNDSRSVWLPTDHFTRLIMETCPNHSYLVKKKLNDWDIMKNFMNSGSPTQGTEINEDPGRINTMPFPKENTVMTVYDGRPLPGRRHVSKLSPGPSTHCGWGVGAQGCKGTNYSRSKHMKTIAKDNGVDSPGQWA